MSIKWSYLSQNQKIGIGFSIIVVILLIVNGLLAVQYSSKPKEVSKSNTDKIINVTNNTVLPESKLPSSTKTTNTKPDYSSLQSKNIISNISDYIDAADSNVEQNIDLPSLSK